MDSVRFKGECYGGEKGHFSFCLLKPECYWFGKKAYIERRIAAAGLKIAAVHQVKLSWSDVLTMYPGRMARVTMTLRFPHLTRLHLYIVEGPQAVQRMHQLKYAIRRELFGLKMGGFVHAPDSVEELKNHISILFATD
jgi:nucleoside diphosphate kinase